MPKKGQPQNYDALGSIFNFIFEQSKKAPDKRKPVPITGVSGNDELTGMIATALTRPAAILTETTINEFNSTLDIELGRVKFDRNGEDIKIRTSKLIDLIKDPAGYIDKVIKDNEGARKAGRARFLGEVMEDFITTSWAYKYGNKEVQSAAVANAVANERAESYRVARSVGQYSRSGVAGSPPEDLDFMSERSLQLLGRKTFGQGWETLRKEDKDEFIMIVSQGGEDSLKRTLNRPSAEANVGTVREYLERKYNANTARNFDSAFSNYTEKKSSGRYERLDPSELNKRAVSIFNPNFYRVLEQDNLTEKINNLSNAAPGSEQENEKRMYEKTKLLLMMDKEGRNRIYENIDYLKQELEGTTDRNRRAEIKRQIKDSKDALRVMGYQGFFANVGKLEGTINSLKATKQTFGEYGSNIGLSILSGTYFRDDTNRYNPITKNSVGGVDILLAKKSNHKGAIGKINNIYNEIGENLYYMTPRSILRTLTYNGEGFARILHKNLGSVEKYITSDIATLGVSMANVRNAFNTSSGRALDLYIEQTLNRLRSIQGPHKLSPADLRRVEMLLKSSKTFKTLTNVFSWPYKMQTMVNKAFGQQLKKARVAFAKMLLKNKGLRDMLVKTGGTKLLGQWIAGGGIKVLVKSLVTAVAGAIGLAGTPIASFLISVGTYIATDVLLKMAKGALVVMKYVTMGLIAIAALILLSASAEVSKFNKRNYSYGNVIPDTVISCEMYAQTPLTYEESIDKWGDVVIPPPSGEQCILGPSQIYCSQGFVDVTGWSHESYTTSLPVDLYGFTYIYAPQFCDSGDCRITEIRAINCRDGSDAGGVVVLEANDGRTVYTFKLLHVRPLAGLGEKLSSGQPVAQVQADLEKGWCWTGYHLHLETRQNGTPVDPMELLQSFNCNAPDETGCSDPN